MKNAFKMPSSNPMTTKKIILTCALMFSVYTITQLALFIAASVQVLPLSCNRLYILFCLIAGSMGLALLFNLVLALNISTKKQYFWTYCLGTLSLLSKMALVIYIAIKGRKHMGQCYMDSTLRDWTYASFSMQALVQGLFMVMCRMYQTQLRRDTKDSFSMTKQFTMDN